MAKRADFHKVIIGRAEELSLVDYGISKVPAKTDTGAYRSAIHASNIKLDPATNELSFDLLGGHPMFGSVATKMTTNDYRIVEITSSFGHEEKRYEVKLKVKLGPKVFLASFSLADRSKKIYPILLGRKMLNGRFLIDTHETSVDRIDLKQKYGVVFPKDEDEVDRT